MWQKRTIQFHTASLADGSVLAARVRTAGTFLARLRGLLFEKELKKDGGLLIRPCNMIHTMGMRFPIDVVYLSSDHLVVSVDESITPNRLGRYVRGAECVLELKAGTLANMRLHPGDRVLFQTCKYSETI